MRKQARSWFYKALRACHQRKWRMLTWCTLLATWKQQQLFRLLVCFAGWRGCRKRKRMYCRLRWAMRPYWHHVRIHQPQSPGFQPSCTVWDKNWEKPGNRFTYFWLPLWWGAHHWACLFVPMQPQCGWCEAWHLAGMWITLCTAFNRCGSLTVQTSTGAQDATHGWINLQYIPSLKKYFTYLLNFANTLKPNHCYTLM